MFLKFKQLFSPNMRTQVKMHYGLDTLDFLLYLWKSMCSVQSFQVNELVHITENMVLCSQVSGYMNFIFAHNGTSELLCCTLSDIVVSFVLRILLINSS